MLSPLSSNTLKLFVYKKLLFILVTLLTNKNKKIMAIRGKVKSVTAGSSRVPTTVTGVVIDTATKVEYPFEQPLGEQLGLEVNSIVQFTTVNVSGTAMAVSLDPIEKATIETIDFNTGTGTLKDKVGTIIPFQQNYAQEMGLAVGNVVKFAPVMVSGINTATALKLPNA